MRSEGLSEGCRGAWREITIWGKKATSKVSKTKQKNTQKTKTNKKLTKNPPKKQPTKKKIQTTKKPQRQ